MKELKDYQRTIRMTKTTRKYLEESGSNGLNEKFENLVYAAYLREEKLRELNTQLQEENKRLEQALEVKRKLLYNKINEVENHLDKILTT